MKKKKLLKLEISLHGWYIKKDAKIYNETIDKENVKLLLAMA